MKGNVKTIFEQLIGKNIKINFQKIQHGGNIV